MVGGCCVCSDERGWPENPLVYCDGQSCTVAVHQACYGIVTVPLGPWYCRKCESQERSARVRCELCPSRDGALKRTDNSGWAHVVCALYIPEVRFGNVTTMEPIILQLIPQERFNKSCYICEKLGKGNRSNIGACMQCNKSGCKQQFHVTCAQTLGLLCEEAGNYWDNVKYCGYCQYHYSKLVSRKGFNVKTIPPYKPISTDNHSSDSGPENETNNVGGKVPQAQGTSATVNSGKRKTSGATKSSSSQGKSSVTAPSKSSVSVTPKPVHNVPAPPAKSASSTSKSAKNIESSDGPVPQLTESLDPANKLPSGRDTPSNSIPPAALPSENSAMITSDSAYPDKSDSAAKEPPVKNSKKRKAGSRTPTPNSVNQTDSEHNKSASVHPNSATPPISAASNLSVNSLDKRDNTAESTAPEKPKKAKTDHTISSSTVVTTSPATIVPVVDTSVAAVNDTSATVAPSATAVTAPPQPQSSNTLVCSLPLAKTNPSLSPSNNQPNSVASAVPQALYAHLPVRTPPPPNTSPDDPNIGISTSLDSTMVSSETSDGLKIAYEKQPQTNSSSLSRLQENAPVSVREEAPAKRARSQSADKSSEKMGRPKKRGTNGLTTSGPATNAGKRASRSQHPTPPPASQPPGAFSSVTQQVMKESPPSSPSDESNGAISGKKMKGRKSAPATIPSISSSSSNTPNPPKVESKDIKVFQNGVHAHAPHMMGNQLNPNSNMAQKMSDHLTQEMEAHSIFNPAETASGLVGPQLHSRVIASVRSNNNHTASSSNSNSGFSSMLGGGSGGAIPQTLDQLLERQWEQGSQFLMEQAQHFDIASLLSCLHQLRAENLRLEEHVNNLLQRRDHLLAVNARLAIPLTNQQPVAAPSQPHTLNNLHPSVTASHGDVPRTRHSSGSSYAGHPGGGNVPPVENGLPPDGAAYPHQHRSPASSQPQPSPTIRHSPAGGSYPSTSGHGVVRSSSVGESSSSRPHRSQPYSQYQGQIPSGSNAPQQQPMVIRRDSEGHHQMPSSKPS